jgi:hypothetical protein
VQTYYQAALVWGRALALAGAALLVSVFWAQGRRVLRVHYRRERWTWRDGLVIAVCVGVAAFIVWTRLTTAGALAYRPYQNMAPAFDPLIGVTLMLLLVPLIAHPSRS